MFIEVKNFNNDLKEDDKAQLINYCRFKKVSKGLLTNGRSWIFYHLDFDRPKYFSKNNIICQVEVSEKDNDEIIENFTRFLSREALAGD